MMKSFLEKINNRLDAQGGFLKAVSVLVGGTAFAQLIGFISLPILTRLYSPEDYSVLGVFVAVVSILAVLSCLRLDIAIPIPEKDEDAKALVLMALAFNIIFTALLYILLFIVYPYIKDFNIVKQLSIWIWLIPLGSILSGVYSTFQYWAVRESNFKKIAHTRVTQAVISNGSSLAIGYTFGGVLGLILGQILNFSSGIFSLGLNAYINLKSCKASSFKSTLKTYQDFPKFSTLEALANTSAIQLPLIIIASFVIGPEVGYLMLSMKVLGVPMGLIGSSMSQVYLAHAPKHFKEGSLYIYTVSVIKKIFRITIIPFILLAIISPYIFTPIFGSDWEGVGSYITLMIPWYFLQILSSPVSMSLHIIGKQKVALFLQLFGFILRVFGLLLIAIYAQGAVVYYYVGSALLFYLIYIYIILKSLNS